MKRDALLAMLVATRASLVAALAQVDAHLQAFEAPRGAGELCPQCGSEKLEDTSSAGGAQSTCLSCGCSFGDGSFGRAHSGGEAT